MSENQSILQQATAMMVEAMRAVKDKTMDPKEATAIAQLGMGVVGAANAEVGFIKATKAIVSNGVLGSARDIQFLEPQVK